VLTELSALLDLLKTKGVTSYRGAISSSDELRGLAVDLTLAATASAPADDTKPDAKQPDPDVCACGHGVHEHQNGLCLMGCDESKCGAKS